jgi:hypothetical protein
MLAYQNYFQQIMVKSAYKKLIKVGFDAAALLKSYTTNI